MKKTILKKTITMLLALTLIFSLSASAFAASVTWTEGETTYTATVTSKGTTRRDVVIPGTTVSHTYGTATTVYCIGTKTSTASYSNPGGTYSSYVKKAASSEGMNTGSISTTKSYNASFTVSASRASCKVAAAISCDYKYGPWLVKGEKNTIMSCAVPGGGDSNLPNVTLGSGTVYAPYDFYSPEIAHAYYY